MKVLYGDPSIGEPPIWDCVGDMLVEIATWPTHIYRPPPTHL
jgi:hypothetical protein